MIERSISSTIDSKYHRARCPVCAVTCGQRRRSVRITNIDIRQALECLECEAIYVADLPAMREPHRDITDAERHRSLEREYGCVNCRNSNPRHCAESGHLDCDALKAEPTLRAGWVFDEKNDEYWLDGTRFGAREAWDGDGFLIFNLGDQGRFPTLEAAMEETERLARGES